MSKLTFVSILITLLGVVIYSCDNSSKEEGSGEETELEETKKTPLTLDDYQDLGDSIVMSTQQALLMELKTAMDSFGAPGAVEYCNLNALNIVQTQMEAFDVSIKRSSLKVRNPLDAPKENEKIVLEEWQFMHDQRDDLIPFAEYLADNRVAYYSPIFLGAPLCQNCHGNPASDITPETLAKIDELYPQDEATGYDLGDFRGIWIVEFDNVERVEL